MFSFALLSFLLESKLIGSILLQAFLNFCSNLSFLAVLCSNSDASSFIILSFCSKFISFIINLFILLPLLSEINDTLFSELNLLSLFTEFFTSEIVDTSSIEVGFESIFILALLIITLFALFIFSFSDVLLPLLLLLYNIVVFSFSFCSSTIFLNSILFVAVFFTNFIMLLSLVLLFLFNKGLFFSMVSSSFNFKFLLSITKLFLIFFSSIFIAF